MSLRTPDYERGPCRMWLADCRDILPHLSGVDAVVTDPPYGVSFSGKRGHYRNDPSFKKDDTYIGIEDSIEEFDSIIVPVVEACRDMSTSMLCFMAGRNVFRLPPGELGGIYLPNGCGRTSWGFQNFMHCVLYGSCPYLKHGMGSRPNGKYGLYGNDANKIDHPCAKPIAAMIWSVERASLPEWLVLDPFMGSGTTGVACIRTGRKFIGIEKEPKYFDIAVKRIDRELDQPRLFPTTPEVQQQAELFAEGD